LNHFGEQKDRNGQEERNPEPLLKIGQVMAVIVMSMMIVVVAVMGVFAVAAASGFSVSGGRVVVDLTSMAGMSGIVFRQRGGIFRVGPMLAGGRRNPTRPVFSIVCPLAVGEVATGIIFPL